MISRPPLRRGMTLVELLLGLAVTGMVGGAVAAMLSAVTYGTGSDADTRAMVVQHKALDVRLGDAIRYSRMALACYTGGDGSRYLVTWSADTRADAGPNRSELRVLRYNPADRTLASYKAPTPAGGWTEANDTKYPLQTDFATSVVPGLVAGTPEVWARGVRDVQFRFDRLANATPTAAQVQAAKLITYRVTLSAGDGSVVVGAAAMRNGSS